MSIIVDRSPLPPQMNAENADCTLQSYVTELNGLNELLDEVIGINVLATLILDYTGQDGRQRINYFLSRRLSPSPVFDLCNESRAWSYDKFINSLDYLGWKRPLFQEWRTSLFEAKPTERSVIVTWKDRRILEVKYEGPLSENIMERNALSESLKRRAFTEAVKIVRQSPLYSEEFILKNVQFFSCLRNDVPELSNDLIKSGLSEKQIKRIYDSKKRVPVGKASYGPYVPSNYCNLLLFKVLLCQKPFNLQFVVQKTAKEVICHLKLNGLPLSERSIPGQGNTEEKAIDDVLTKSSQYLLEMTNALTHREFRIIETELLRRSVPPETHVLANILQQNSSVNLM